MFFQWAIMLNKIPKIHVKSFKTVDARASGLHFTTPSWAWSWPWGWYQKLSVIIFQRAIMLNKIPQISWLRLQNCACQAFRTPFSNTFLSLRSAQKVVPKIWPDQVLHLCSAYDISKDQLSGASGFWEIALHWNTLPCLLLYVGFDRPYRIDLMFCFTLGIHFSF